MDQIMDDNINMNHIHLKNKEKNQKLNQNIHCFESLVKDICI